MKGVITVKKTYSIAQRNEIVEDNLWRINATIKRNWALIRAARMDKEDVYQQLAVRLIRAVGTFDPEKGTLEQHLNAQLQFEMLNCKDPIRLHGMRDVPRDFRGDKIISFESIHEDSPHYAALAA